MKNKAVINYPTLITRDSKGNITHVKNSFGYKLWKEYDESNTLRYSRHSNGREHWYDENGKVIHSKYVDGREHWYDENGKVIHSKYSDGSEYWYDSDGNKISDPNLVTEVTFDDIAKKFGVNVKSLKIKK